MKRRGAMLRVAVFPLMNVGTKMYQLDGVLEPAAVNCFV